MNAATPTGTRRDERRRAMSDLEPDQRANLPLDPSMAVEHAPLCRRPRPPITRLSWRNLAEELYFPCCGRYGPAPTEPGRPAHQQKEG